MKRTIFILVISAALIFSSCIPLNVPPKTVKGSGVSAKESRVAANFSAIELAGSATVNVIAGDNESVIIEGDDNLLPYILTEVRSGKLVIRTKDNINYTTSLGIRITVTAITISAANISGSGNLTIKGVQAESARFDLQGSGTLSVSGKAQKVSANLSGSGNILCKEVIAESATAEISGSGTITLYASKSLKASIPGSGNIQYAGNPAEVDKKVLGSGNIVAVP